MITIINEKTRDNLGEGRSYQMGFAFLKKLRKKDTYETVQPISPCKDYLNDVVFAEHSGRSISAYGLTATKKNIFKDGAYLCFAICPNKYGEYAKMKEDIQRLSESYVHIEKMINEIEKKFNLNELSKITQVNEDLYFVDLPKFWIQATYTISLYSLLIRAFQYVKKYEDPIELMGKYPYNLEAMLVRQSLPKMIKAFEEGFKAQDFSKLTGTSVHNFGILEY